MTLLKIHFEYLMPIARVHTVFFKGEHHFKWVLAPTDASLHGPEYLINNVLSNRSSNEVKALYRLLRFPTRFEGGTDFIFERQVSVALRLLFDPDDILNVQYVPGHHTRSRLIPHTVPLNYPPLRPPAYH